MKKRILELNYMNFAMCFAINVTSPPCCVLQFDFFGKFPPNMPIFFEVLLYRWNQPPHTKLMSIHGEGYI